jgi:predicted transcriptional regulator
MDSLIVKKIPQRWIRRRYAVLWEKFGEKEFEFNDALEVLRANDDTKSIVSLFLSDLKRAGWVKIRIDPKDSRKRVYQLYPLQHVSKEIIAYELHGDVKNAENAVYSR